MLRGLGFSRRRRGKAAQRRRTPKRFAPSSTDRSSFAWLALRLGLLRNTLPAQNPKGIPAQSPGLRGTSNPG